jgi:hypothetical protein
MPRVLSAFASAFRLVAPSSRSMPMAGRTRRACASAFARIACTASALPRPASAFAPFGLPSFCPRALAAASAARVRSEILRASSSATAARMCKVRRFAVGLSAAMNSTPLSIMAATKAMLRARRSSFAMITVAPVRRACSSALWSSGRSAFLPVSTSTCSATRTRPSPRKRATASRWAASPRPLAPWRAVLTR